MRTYYRHPSTERGEFNRDFGGIVGSIRGYHKHLPQFGWTETMSEDDADLVAGHLSTRSRRLDAFHLHGLYPTSDHRFGPSQWQQNATIIDNIRRTRTVIAVSDWVAQLLRRDMHMRPFVVPSAGIDLTEWDAIPRGEYSTQPFVLWNKTRGHGVCDPTPVARLAEKFPKTNFVTTFYPQDAPDYTNVTITGLLNHADAWKIVRDSHIYLATTKETFGLSTLEAMASGAVVIGFDWGATPDVVGDTGILVEPNNYEALAWALNYAIEHHDEIAAKARLRVEKEYTWEAVVGLLAKCYDATYEEMHWDGPKVTVVIPVYNYQKYVTDAINSVREQTLTNFECFVVNDGSTDNSEGQIKNAIAGDPRFHYIYQDNAGVAHARNNGISHGTAPFITCLDADDMMEPTLLEVLYNAMIADNSIGIAYTGLAHFRPDGKRHNGTWPRQFDASRGTRGNQVPTCCMFKRIWWERLGGFRQRYAPHGAGQEDGDFWFRIASNGGKPQKVTEDHLFLYRYHRQQTTKIHRNDWSKDLYFSWHPFIRDGLHPLASLTDEPRNHSFPVRNYDCPEVAVIIPVGPGHEDMLVDAMDSVEAQSFRNWEVIVVNDTGNSIDMTSYPYSKYIETEGKMGAGYARNRGIEASISPYFTCLDADDYLQPFFIERTLEARKLNPDNWIYTDMYILKPTGAVEEYMAPDWEPFRLWRRGIAPVTCLYSRDNWIKVSGFDEESTREDWDYHLRLAKHSICGARLPELLFTYRHGTGFRRSEGSRRQEAQKLRKIYSKEEIEMACKKCGGKRRQKNVRLPAHPDAREVSGHSQWEVLEYTGKAQSALTFRGVNPRRVYRFSAGQRNRYKRVHPDDVQKFLKFAYFRIAPKDRRDVGSRDTVLSEPAPRKRGEVKATPKPKAKPKPKLVKKPQRPPRGVRKLAEVERPGEVDAPEPKPEPTPDPVPTDYPIPPFSEESMLDDIEAPDVLSLVTREVEALVAKDELNILQYKKMYKTEQARNDRQPRAWISEVLKRKIRKLEKAY